MQHENIVQFIGAYAEIPNVFIVTEIVEPGSLRDVLRNKRMKLDRSAKFVFTKSIFIYFHDVNGENFYED